LYRYTTEQKVERLTAQLEEKKTALTASHAALKKLTADADKAAADRDAAVAERATLEAGLCELTPPGP
jgi:hypothetical protein